MREVVRTRQQTRWFRKVDMPRDWCQSKRLLNRWTHEVPRRPGRLVCCLWWHAWPALFARGTTALCVAGVALGDIGVPFAAPGDIDAHFAWRLWHWAGSGGSLGWLKPPGALWHFVWQRGAFAWQEWHLVTSVAAWSATHSAKGPRRHGSCVWQSYVWQSCVWKSCVWKSCVWGSCVRVWQTYVWQSCVWKSCVWGSCVCVCDKLMRDKVVCE